jgi:hypothetical protein
MQNTSVTLAFIDLIILAVAPGIVGGVVGLVGGLLGSYFGPRWLQDQKESAEKKRRRAEKFEEFVRLLHEHKHWLNEARRVHVYGLSGEVGESPMHKAIAIMTVYFPEHYQKLNDLDVAADKCESWMMQAGTRRIKGEPEFAGGFKEVTNPYIQNFIAFSLC